MKHYVKHIVMLAVIFCIEMPLFGFGIPSLKQLWGNSKNTSAAKEQKENIPSEKEEQKTAEINKDELDKKLLEVYRKRLAKWENFPYKTKDTTALIELNKVIAQEDTAYRKFLINENKGEFGKVVLKRLLNWTSSADQVSAFESFVNEWQFDLNENEIVHWLTFVPFASDNTFDNNRPQLIIKAIELGADVNKKDANDDTPLHVTSNSVKQFDIMRILVDHGADRVAVNKQGQTAAHKKAKICTKDSLASLYYLGFEANYNGIKDDQGKTVKDYYLECMKKGPR